ncbi:MAG: hypothetical protein ACP5OZ_00795 [Candidatus Woesearchaeota archaeon]
MQNSKNKNSRRKNNENIKILIITLNGEEKIMRKIDNNRYNLELNIANKRINKAEDKAIFKNSKFNSEFK